MYLLYPEVIKKCNPSIYIYSTFWSISSMYYLRAKIQKKIKNTITDNIKLCKYLHCYVTNKYKGFNPNTQKTHKKTKFNNYIIGGWRMGSSLKTIQSFTCSL